jgi:uncharacterized protein YbjT (DUF2867 family)
VFSVQPLMLGKRAKVEVEWGKSFADQARQAGVAHLVYSSVFGSGSAADLPHFASKHEIETHLQSIGLPYTILQPAAFMENLLLPLVRKGIVKGKLTLPNAIVLRSICLPWMMSARLPPLSCSNRGST